MLILYGYFYVVNSCVKSKKCLTFVHRAYVCVLVFGIFVLASVCAQHVYTRHMCVPAARTFRFLHMGTGCASFVRKAKQPIVLDQAVHRNTTQNSEIFWTRLYIAIVITTSARLQIG